MMLGVRQVYRFLKAFSTLQFYSVLLLNEDEIVVAVLIQLQMRLVHYIAVEELKPGFG